MKYRDVEFTIGQGPRTATWKWSASLRGIEIRGQAATKAEAVSEAERSIDRALVLNNLKLIKPVSDNQTLLGLA
ncbi:hypothetical protein [Bradyrhizobium sp. JYMT SZCCT0428]|uniref:hypothetical protein n=1 Tax=Bradyrhizobium sp. JYMT SZCCT0428 TaxID=2807673 RepID=UPI001BA61F7D|nr:hypothetical protein [Bradyrhizobium sp. JYMT SZCCT0428]MBR1154805.1 hypothetical protein [Bradyrhizobium sp. JYMT SZCCT0428]